MSRPSRAPSRRGALAYVREPLGLLFRHVRHRTPRLALAAVGLAALSAACSDPSSPPAATPSLRAAGADAHPKLLSAATLPAQAGTQPEWITDQYIVVLKRSISDPNGTITAMIEKFGGRVVQRYGTAVKGVTLRISESFAQTLAEDPNVEFVEQDQMAHGAAVQTGVPWWLDRVDSRGGDDANYTYYGDGTGVTIYILDSGLNLSHVEFTGRVSAGADFIDPSTGGVDCHGHGTGVAAIAAGTTFGVAKKARLVAVRVLPCSLDQPVSTIIAGVDWVTAQRAYPAVANMSISVDHSDALDQAIANSIASGVTYVVAAGNNAEVPGVSPDACDFSPGSARDAITVAATNQFNQVAYFSKTGPCVDLFAPGDRIQSATIGSSTATTAAIGSYLSGTSMAAPFVAGTAALYLQRNPTATPAEVRTAIVNNATPNTVTYTNSVLELPAGTPSLMVYTGFVGNPSPLPGVARVAMTVPTTTIAVGQSTQANITATSAVGAVLTGRPVVWSSSDPVVASISPTGEIIGVSPGITTILASSEGVVSTRVSVRVTPTVVPAGDVTPLVNAAGYGCIAVTENLGFGTSAKCATGNVAQLWSRPVVGQAVPLVANASGGCLTAYNSAGIGAPIGTYTCVGWGTQTWNLTSAGALKLADTEFCATAVPEVTYVRLELQACNGSAAQRWTAGGSSPVAPVSSIVLGIQPPTITTGQVVTAAPVLRDVFGTTLVGKSLAWSTSNPAAVTVTPAGVLTAVAPGTATITLASEGKSNSIIMTVVPPSVAPVAAVTVALASSSLQTTQTTTATATLKDAAGNVLAGRTITWTSSNPAVATVSPTGLVVAVAPGNVTITATSEGKLGSAPLTVTAPVVVPVATVTVAIPSTNLRVGQTAAATATLKDALGIVLTGRTVTWTTSASAVATVSSTGVVTAVAPGTATITATSEGKSGSVSVTVTVAPVATVNVTIAKSSLVVRQTTTATATLKDAAGNVLTGRTVTWSSSKTTVATVSSSGVVTAVAAGTASIIATSEGKTGSVAVTVTVSAVSTVGVSIASASVPVGQTSQATATLKDASGTVLTGRTVTWSTSSSSIATVSSSGLVTAVAPGTATITATSEGKSGSVSVTVTNPVASVSVTIADASLTLPQTSQATATLKDSRGNVLTGRTVTWSSSNSGVATVSSSGLVTAVAAGSATITATSEGKSGAVAVTVTGATVASVTTTISDATLEVGQTATATATPKDASGRAITGRTITWTTSNASVATVSSSGVVTAVGPGSATITGATSGKSGSTSVTVAAPPVAKLDIDCYRTACGFDARESTNTVSWAWTWGDGKSELDDDGWTYHVYDDDVNRTYTVTLKVTNAGGTSRSITRSITCRSGTCSSS